MAQKKKAAKAAKQSNGRAQKAVERNQIPKKPNTGKKGKRVKPGKFDVLVGLDWAGIIRVSVELVDIIVRVAMR